MQIEARPRAANVHAGIVIELVTIGWMIVEASVALGIGFASHSVSLQSFGIDSVIELFAGGIVLSRLRTEQRTLLAGADVGAAASIDLIERRASRIVGWALYGPGNKKIAERTGPADLAAHHQNFLDCIRGSAKAPTAGVMAGHHTASLVHLANIGARVGRVLHFDPQAETIVGDSEAAAMVARHYREGHWAVPKMS